MDSVSEKQNQTASSSRNSNELLSQLDALISRRLADFEEKVVSNQQKLSESQLTKIEELNNDSYTFKKKSCEDQHKFNVKAMSNLKEAHSHLEKTEGEPAAKAAEKIVKGMELLSHRQKLIKLADGSEAGWKVVDEYTQNPLAENSDDEKRMEKAESRALRKIKASKAKRSGRVRPYSTMAVSEGQSKGLGGNNIPVHLSSGAGRKPGLCFNCWRPGHWKNECVLPPQPAPQGMVPGAKNDKISTFACLPVSCTNVENLHVGQLDGSRVKQSVVSVTTTGETMCSQVESVYNLGRIDTGSVKTAENVNKHSPVGRLKSCYNKWVEAGANRHVLDVIQNGYKLPFKELPGEVELSNNKSALENPSFVESEIKKLLEKGCVTEVSSKPKVISPLTVAYNRKGKPRLVLDCSRAINCHLVKFKFKYEDVSVAKDIFEKGDNLVTFDVRGAYHHVCICEDHKTFLGFSFVVDGRKRYFVWEVMAFGISTAGHMFTKIMRVFVQYLRSRGNKLCVFLDDGLAGHSDKQKAVQLSKYIQKSLDEFGFLIAQEKCMWVPSLSAEWCGYVWNMSIGKISAIEARIDRLEDALDSALRKLEVGVPLIKVRFLASIVGQIISMQNAVGKLVRLRTSDMYSCILARASWNAPVLMTERAIDEMRFWRGNVRQLNEVGMMLCDDVRSCDVVAYSDASGTAYGGYLALSESHLYEESEYWTAEESALIEGSEVLGVWTTDEMSMSSTYREAEAVRRILHQSKDRLAGIGLKQRVEKHSAERLGDVSHLSDRLSFYILHSKSDNTVSKYFSGFGQWQKYCGEKNIPALPANPIHFAIYITHLLDSGASYSKVSSINYSVKWAHDLNGLEDPTKNSFVVSLLDSAKRLRSVKTVKKDPITADILIELCDKHKDSTDLLVVRDLSMILLGFAGFLRFDELSSLKCRDITFQTDFVKMIITKSKTDQYRSGDEVLVSKGQTSACPYAMLLRYIHLAEINLKSDKYFFRPAFRSGGVCKLIYKNKKISYTRARECVLSRLRTVVTHLNLGLHSLRSGGATAAANRDVNDRCWKRHGRWKRDSSKDGYVVDDVEHRLEVTKQLGL